MTIDIETSSQLYKKAERILARAREEDQRMRSSLIHLVQAMVHSCSEGDRASVYWAAEKYARIIALDGVSVELEELRDTIREAKDLVRK